MSTFRFMRTEREVDWTLVQEIRDPNGRRQVVLSKRVSPEKVSEVIGHLGVDARAVGSPFEQLTSFLSSGVMFRSWMESEYDQEKVTQSLEDHTPDYMKKIYEDYGIEREPLVAAVHYFMINGPLAPIVEDLPITLGEVGIWLAHHEMEKKRLQALFDRCKE